MVRKEQSRRGNIQPETEVKKRRKEFWMTSQKIKITTRNRGKKRGKWYEKTRQKIKYTTRIRGKKKKRKWELKEEAEEKK